MCLTANNFGLQEEKNQHIDTAGEKTLIRKTGWGTTETERDRWTERERKVFEADKQKQKPSPKCHFTYICLLFYFALETSGRRPVYG